MSNKLEALGLVGLILFIIVLIAVVAFWWWVSWIVAGIIIAYIGFDGGHPFALQIFIWMVLIAVVSMIGRIGQKITQ